MPSMRRFMPLVAWGSVALGILALVFTGEARLMLSALGAANWWLVLPLLLIGMVLPVAHARRWQIMLRSLDHDLSLDSAIDLTISSTMINYAAPGYLWSPAKGMLARQMFGIGLGRSVPTLAIEQVLDALALVAGTIVGLALAGPEISTATFDRLHAPTSTTIIVTLVVTVAIVLLALYLFRRYASRFWSTIVEASKLLAKDRSLRVPVLGLTVARWVLDTGAIWLAAKAVGISLGISSLVLISNLPLLVGLLSPMPGGVGFREGAMAGVAGVLTLTVSVILAAAVLNRAVMVLSLPLVFGLTRLRRRVVA